MDFCLLSNPLRILLDRSSPLEYTVNTTNNGKNMNIVFLTICCRAYDTFWDDLHVCRACGQPNPLLIEVEVDEQIA